MKFVYRHLELADFIVYCYTEGNIFEYKSSDPEYHPINKLSWFYSPKSEGYYIVKEFFD